MQIREIQEFTELRPQVRAYFCFLFTRNIPNYLPSCELDPIVAALKKIHKESGTCDALYILDSKGVQLIDNIAHNPLFRKGKGENRSQRAYYYRAAREKKCILTDPYPSLLGGQLTVTAAYPVYDENNHLRFIVCVDISLSRALAIVKPTQVDNLVGSFNKLVYGALSFSLLIVVGLLFFKGMTSIYHSLFTLQSLDIKEMFEATILLTLSLAIFDLVKAIFEEEVLGRYRREEGSQIHKTMTRFLGSIIIAISIEALMLVFKFTLIEPDKIIYAVYLIGGVMMLLVGLAIYLYLASHAEKECKL